MFIEPGLLRGTRGRNRFGPDPQERPAGTASGRPHEFESSLLSGSCLGAIAAGLAILVAVILLGSGNEAVSETAPDPAAAAAACSESLGRLTGRPQVRSGAWDGSCDAVHYYDGRHARYFSFELERSAVVTIDLTSSDVDTVPALRGGTGAGTRFVESGTGCRRPADEIT